MATTAPNAPPDAAAERQAQPPTQSFTGVETSFTGGAERPGRDELNVSFVSSCSSRRQVSVVEESLTAMEAAPGAGLGGIGAPSSHGSFSERASIISEDGLSPNHCDPSDELWNLLCLSLVFAVYFGFRSGCLIVLPLVSKALLHEALDGAPRSPLYQLPLGVWFGMDILLATPNAYTMKSYGRRVGFLAGAVASVIGSILAFAALRFHGDKVVAFILLNVAVCVMSVLGMAEFVRFAAAEACSDPARRAVQVGRVITSGAVMSMFGPFSSSLAQSMTQPNHPIHGYSYFFLFMAALGLVGVGAARGIRLPPVADAEAIEAPPLLRIVRRPAVWSAMFIQLSVQFAMVAPMSAVPLAMSDVFDFTAADIRLSACIVCHVLSMFLPGLVTGTVVSKVGTMPVVVAGLVLQAAALVVALSGESLLHFYIALILLGIGWNLAFVSSTVLLIQSHEPEERTKVTSANETARFVANGVAVILSSSVDWDVVNYVSFAFVGCVVLLLGVQAFSRRQPAEAS
eukprot:TRINITY_DN12255_c1_g2_i1.p1 TRINITY_DN12255_c1_g2~~TRINITY_DN12255_c1_g2_i1.p1  ORF type:complete len:539 (+),score=63.32 TRINITY_DN12255_c1_g2_i1:74-1618(+)